jgi:N-acetylneuraminic acid mutarotase
MPAPRSQHGSAAIDGKIYVVGGVVRGPDLRALWAYDPVSGEWDTKLPSMPTEREHLSVVEAGGRLYAIGGRKGRNFTAVEAYDPKTNRWETLPGMPTARGGMAVGVIGAAIHTAGGENLEALSTYPQHEILDTTTMTWSKGPDLPTKRHGLAAAVVGNRWYVIGGGRSAMLSVSNIVEVFTP